MEIRLHIMLMHASIINCVCVYSMPITNYICTCSHQTRCKLSNIRWEHHGNSSKRSVGGVAKPLLAPICAKTDSTRKMRRTKAARKRRNKNEFRARLIQEIEAMEASIANLKIKLKEATAEMKIVKRYIITHNTFSSIPQTMHSFLTFTI